MQEVDLRDFFRMLWRQKWIIIIAVVLCTSASLLKALVLTPRQYTATATLLYSETGGINAANMIASSLGLNLSGTGGPAAWYEMILESRTMARRLVHKFHLTKVFKVGNEDKATTILLKQIVITAKPEAKALMISVNMPGTPLRYPGRPVDADRAKLAADLVNELINQLNHWLQTNDYQSSSQQRRYIENQLNGILAQVNLTREELNRTFKRTGVFAPDQQGQLWLSALSQIETQIAATKTQLSQVEVAAGAVTSKQPTRRLASAVEAANKNEYIALLRRQIGELEVQRRRELEVNHKTADHPDVEQLDQSIDELTVKLNTELKIVREGQRLEQERLDVQLGQSQSRWEDLQKRLAALPAQSLEVEDLRHQLSSTMGLVDMLTKQLMLARIAEEEQTEHFNVLDPAEAPLKHSSPSFLLACVVGLAMGLTSGLLIACGRHYLKSGASA